MSAPADATTLPQALQLRLRLHDLRVNGAITDHEEHRAAFAAGAVRQPPAKGPRVARRGASHTLKGNGDDEEEEKAECPICFERYCTEDRGIAQPLCVLLGPNGMRAKDSAGSCRHFFHVDCIKDMTQKNCPMCRRAYSQIGVLPDVRDHRQHHRWFQLIDADGDGSLSKREVVDVLRVTMPVVDDTKMITEYVDRLWPQVDRSGTGQCGLRELPNLFQELGRCLPGQSVEKKPPRLTASSKADWFRFWDEDHSGGLDKREMTRALVKTFRNYGTTAAGIASARGTLDAVWCIFDDSGDGIIDLQEFCQPDGLGDAMILAGCGSPREEAVNPPSGGWDRQPSMPPGGWGCPACTFINLAESRECGVCASPRP
eukprot:Hpha_TRINITY_DN13225_c0_g1::TRINITY_DN13225_c0_g1_i1::g.154660::m.154660